MSEKEVYFSLNETSSPGLVTNGDSHDHSGGDGAQISHAGLGNLQGGTAGEYYHLTAAEYAALGSGSESVGSKLYMYSIMGSL